MKAQAARSWIGRVVKVAGRQFIPNVGTLLLVALLLWAQQAGAFSFGGPARPQGAAPPNALPGTITYQGKLTDAGGTPVTGNVDMAFALYAVPAGGTALWSETQAAVPVQKGEFTVNLGRVNPLPAGIWEQDILYLGITVGTDAEMTPREEISSAARALLAVSVADGGVESRDLDLDYGTDCLANSVAVGLPGGGQAVQVPELQLDFTLQRPSMVLVWMDGLASITQPSTNEYNVLLAVDGTYVGSTAGYKEIFLNASTERILALGSGSHTVTVLGRALNPSTMVIEGNSAQFRFCINYLVLGEQ